jgi:hypothetical protein
MLKTHLESLLRRTRPRAGWGAPRVLSALAVAVACGLALGPAASPASADFGFDSLESAFSEEGGETSALAGAHPFAWTTTLGFSTVLDSQGEAIPDQALKDLRINLPAGVVGTPALLPRCSRAEFAAESCPPGSQVGSIALNTSSPETVGTRYPVYNLLPLHGNAAELGFVAVTVPVTIELGIDPEPPNNLTASLANTSQLALVYGSELTVGGRIGATPFLTLPRSCGDPLTTTFEATSWQEPGRWVSDQASAPGLGGCGDLGFSPVLSAEPTATAAHRPTGLDVTLDLPDGLTTSEVPLQTDVRAASFHLPEGLSLNPALAAGLGSCTPAELGREAVASDPGGGCPAAAKVGTAAVKTPLFDEVIPGAVYVAEPDDPATTRPGAENPFDALFALYVAIKSPVTGVFVYRALKLEPDPETGRLLATVEELPQLPISHLEMHFRDGPRAPLRTPSTCGTYRSRHRLVPWSGGSAVEGSSSFAITQDCASGGFDPQFRAGTVDPPAGSHSTFILDFTRRDGEQNPEGLSFVLPPGLSATFAGVPLCPEAGAATGACPPGSRVGSVNVAAGTGAAPLWVPPTAERAAPVFLSGPYRGAPFGLVAVVPVEAGPYDLGAVVLRAAIRVDRATGRPTVEVDPLPQIVSGVPIDYRAIHLELDRPGFIRNPTSCRRLSVDGLFTSSRGRQARSEDLFQASGCGKLGFEPKLSLRLRGPVHRGASPALQVRLATRGGDANLRRFALALPPTELLDVRRIRGVCSAGRLGASACPARSAYGQATVWSPLLREPLHGPVYLSASRHRLPNLVASLHGKVGLDLTARLDTARGRLRATFADLPDLPLRKVVLTLRGGGRGLFVNSGGLCKRDRRIVAQAWAQNGKSRKIGSAIQNDCT